MRCGWKDLFLEHLWGKATIRDGQHEYRFTERAVTWWDLKRLLQLLVNGLSSIWVLSATFPATLLAGSQRPDHSSFEKLANNPDKTTQAVESRPVLIAFTYDSRGGRNHGEPTDWRHAHGPGLMGATLRRRKRSEGQHASNEYPATSAVPQFHEQGTNRESNSGPTDRDNSRNCRAGAIWRPAGVFDCRAAGEHRLELATEPRGPNVCLHFRGVRGGRGSGYHSHPPFTRTRLCEKKYFCNDNSSWTRSWKATYSREAGPGKHGDVDESMDEFTQRHGTNLRPIIAQTHQRGSGARGGQPRPTQ